jgi:hypothetical protein
MYTLLFSELAMIGLMGEKLKLPMNRVAKLMDFFLGEIKSVY